MKQYLDLMRHVRDNGVIKTDRTGTGTKSVFGYQMRFDLSKGFPLMTTKDMSGKRIQGIIKELLWFIRGDTNMATLAKDGINIWNRDAYKQYTTRVNNPVEYNEFVEKIKTDPDFAEEHGDLGPIYGKQWTSWEAPDRVINQLEDVIRMIQEDPNSRRLIVTAWNPADVPKMALPPCHTLFQFYVAKGKLSCQLYQRSADIFLGVPYNIASYALLTMAIARSTGLEVGEFIHTLGDAHIYLNHMEQVEEQLSRKPYELPTMVINPNVTSIFDLTEDDFVLTDYKSHPPIKAPQSF